MSGITITLDGRRLREVPERWDGRPDQKNPCVNCALGSLPIAQCREAERLLRAQVGGRTASCITRHSMWEAVDA